MKGNDVPDYELIRVYVEACRKDKGWRWIIEQFGFSDDSYDGRRKNCRHLKNRVTQLRRKIDLPRLSQNPHNKIGPYTQQRELGGRLIQLSYNKKK